MYIHFHYIIFPCYVCWPSIGGKKMSVFDTAGFVIFSIIFICIVIGIIALVTFLKGRLRVTYLVKMRVLSIYVVAIMLISLLYIVFVLPKMEVREIGSIH